MTDRRARCVGFDAVCDLLPAPRLRRVLEAAAQENAEFMASVLRVERVPGDRVELYDGVLIHTLPDDAPSAAKPLSDRHAVGE